MKKESINFEDIRCWIDTKEQIKKEYVSEEMKNKMDAIKFYYKYHTDCPRIFGEQSVAEIY